MHVLFIFFFCCVQYLKSAPGFYFLFIGQKAQDLGLPTPSKRFFGQHKENLRKRPRSSQSMQVTRANSFKIIAMENLACLSMVKLLYKNI
jgi:hypothetical protein